MSIQTDLQRFKKIIADAEKSIHILQKTCTHPHESLTIRNYRCNDDFDTTARYANDCHCGICDYRWTVKES